MLTLKRHTYQRPTGGVIDDERKSVLVLGDDIRVQCMAHKDGQVTLAIEAPRDVTIRREEVTDTRG